MSGWGNGRRPPERDEGRQRGTCSQTPACCWMSGPTGTQMLRPGAGAAGTPTDCMGTSGSSNCWRVSMTNKSGSGTMCSKHWWMFGKCAWPETRKRRWLPAMGGS